MKRKDDCMNVPFVDLKTQYQNIREEIDPAIGEVVSSAWFVGGPRLKAFEEQFASFCGAEHAIGVSSGTAALHVALVAAGVGSGDEVITAPNTFIATTEAITLAGARPVFVDVDPESCNIDPGLIEKAITDRTRAIMPIHLYGQPADMDPILKTARRHDLLVIEDACQAHGAEYKGSKVGPLGHIGCFSFYPGKNLGAYGDGGMVVTNDPDLAETVRMLTNHGQKEKNRHPREGFNYRLDAIQAAVLGVKLKHLERWNTLRRDHARLYSELLAGLDVKTPGEKEFAKHVFHLYIIRLDRRDELAEHLASRGVSVGFHYPVALHLQKAYARLGYGPGSFPQAEASAAQALSLPMFPELTEAQIRYVAEAVAAFR
jgi:dTDP-4-amino-4,6-dideoxygalactose transaminase